MHFGKCRDSQSFPHLSADRLRLVAWRRVSFDLESRLRITYTSRVVFDKSSLGAKYQQESDFAGQLGSKYHPNRDRNLPIMGLGIMLCLEAAEDSRCGKP